MTMRASDRRRAAGAVVLALLFGVALGALGAGGVATGAGSDVISIFEYEPDELEAEPGETVTVDIELFAGGAAHDIGVDRVNVTLTHDPDGMAVTDVEAGAWLAESGADVLVETDVDDEAGTVSVN